MRVARLRTYRRCRGRSDAVRKLKIVFSLIFSSPRLIWKFYDLAYTSLLLPAPTSHIIQHSSAHLYAHSLLFTWIKALAWNILMANQGCRFLTDWLCVPDNLLEIHLINYQVLSVAALRRSRGAGKPYLLSLKNLNNYAEV
jgi:hypothetical protein